MKGVVDEDRMEWGEEVSEVATSRAWEEGTATAGFMAQIMMGKVEVSMAAKVALKQQEFVHKVGY